MARQGQAEAQISIVAPLVLLPLRVSKLCPGSGTLPWSRRAAATAAAAVRSRVYAKEGQQLGLLPRPAAPRRSWLGPSNVLLETTKSGGQNRPRAPPTRAGSEYRTVGEYQLLG